MTPEESRALLERIEKSLTETVGRHVETITLRDSKIIRLCAEAVWAPIVAAEIADWP